MAEIIELRLIEDPEPQPKPQLRHAPPHRPRYDPTFWDYRAPIMLLAAAAVIAVALIVMCRHEI